MRPRSKRSKLSESRAKSRRFLFVFKKIELADDEVAVLADANELVNTRAGTRMWARLAAAAVQYLQINQAKQLKITWDVRTSTWTTT